MLKCRRCARHKYLRKSREGCACGREDVNVREDLWPVVQRFRLPLGVEILSRTAAYRSETEKKFRSQKSPLRYFKPLSPCPAASRAIVIVMQSIGFMTVVRYIQYKAVVTYFCSSTRCFSIPLPSPPPPSHTRNRRPESTATGCMKNVRTINHREKDPPPWETSSLPRTASRLWKTSTCARHIFLAGLLYVCVGFTVFLLLRRFFEKSNRYWNRAKTHRERFTSSSRAGFERVSFFNWFSIEISE